MAFGTTPVSTTTLGTNQFPVSAVAVPGETGGNLTALEGGPESTDSNGNKTAPASMYVKDGNDVTLGLKADSAATDSTSSWSAIALLKGILAKVLGTIAVTGTFWQAIQPATLSVGTAITPYGSNPAQTAASGADTQYKFGAGGTSAFTHCAFQNNGSVSIFYAFDQDTTTAGHQVYILASGQTAAWDRSGTVLHFSSASQVAFGGQSGITVEAFA